MIEISIDGTPHDVAAGDRLVDAINRAGVPLSQVCYLPILGPIQTCDKMCIRDRKNHHGREHQNEKRDHYEGIRSIESISDNPHNCLLYTSRCV